MTSAALTVSRCPHGARALVQVDRLAELLEEALRHLLRLACQAADPAQDALLVGRQVLRHDALDDDELVAAPAGPDVGHAPAPPPEGLPVLRPRRPGVLHPP